MMTEENALLPPSPTFSLSQGRGQGEERLRLCGGEGRITLDSSGTWEKATMNTATVAISGTTNIAGFHARSSGFPKTVVGLKSRPGQGRGQHSHQTASNGQDGRGEECQSEKMGRMRKRVSEITRRRERWPSHGPRSTRLPRPFEESTPRRDGVPHLCMKLQGPVQETAQETVCKYEGARNRSGPGDGAVEKAS